MKENNSQNIKFTVITVCYNSEKTIERTLQSIKDQTYKNIEYIIIDGGSTDKTLEIISNYSDIVNILVSEPDNGIYDAMNKGIKLATGDYIGFLNSDDYYTNNIFEEYNEALIKEIVDYIYSDAFFVKNSNMEYVNSQPRIINKVYQYMPFLHLSLYVKSSILKTNIFDVQFNIAGDLDFLNKLVRITNNYAYISKGLCYFEDGGISTNQLLNTLNESKRVALKHGKKIFSTNIYYGYRLFIYYLSYLIGNTYLYHKLRKLYKRIV
ncbi:glycosyltransferase family 2 protein [Francisella philomiragia]|uniref:glycosyltransferase family 2 protein n=1 Tax=Francisella philomiragia TaxID=28110 RepID=UPI00190681BE|nr:glycosyltransferase family 2 protein [Francisella philomiragia]MBK2255834.1 glycosyltransferase [Francisella philomiragia]MBK2268492.1 glycosyltransferase [Francisella philomiragia]MBK2271033.1 glycosyltransferase [Francisella philomiragia]MBK2274813.1 glycosyltransferase [Francisella philomiragia]MBK2294407.1 glycosyltransferase [Francisella philomiragia]